MMHWYEQPLAQWFFRTFIGAVFAELVIAIFRIGGLDVTFEIISSAFVASLFVDPMNL